MASNPNAPVDAAPSQEAGKIPILVIDDDQDMCELVEAGLAPHGFDVEWCTRAAEGLELLVERDFKLVLTDLQLVEASGLDVCKRVHEIRPDVPTIVMTAFGNMEAAIDALRAGAHDFINKPFDFDALSHTVRRAVQHQWLQDEVKRLTGAMRHAGRAGELVGESAAIRRVFDLVHRVSDTDASVLLTGESGTGKELVARALHTESSRASRPFQALNCAAVPASLLESELFGHIEGAFTDAKATRKGLFEQADGGTVLLDEIAEMPLDMQPKLLRVLQEKKVRPLGGHREVPFDTRIIAATNRDLEAEVEQGRFREDLYYRLNVIQIHVPPLRARGNDVLLLAQHFLEKCAARLGKPVKAISAEAAQKLVDYDWPGNVRQLENSIERAITLTRFDHLTVDDLPERVRKFDASPAHVIDLELEHMMTLEQLERRYIERVLKASAGNKTQAAKVLGVDRRTLYRKLERYEAD